MQSEFLAASVEILREFAEKCWQEGACEAQNDAAKEIEKNYIARIR
jgi:monoamine oxidase